MASGNLEKALTVLAGIANPDPDPAAMQRRTIDGTKLLLGRGDFVFIAARGTHEGEPCLYIDLYRVENLKIVEHRGFPRQVPPQPQRKNRHGMLWIAPGSRYTQQTLAS